MHRASSAGSELLPGQEYAQRFRLVAGLIAVELALSSVLRLALIVSYRDATTAPRALPAVLAYGVAFDALATLTAFLPIILVIAVFRLRWSRGWIRTLLVTAFAFALAFDAFVQFFFFDEYSARYNHLALDYLMYPDEVFGNILASYNVPVYAGLAMVVAVIAGWRLTRVAVAAPPLSWRNRVFGIAATATLGILLWLGWTVTPAAISSNRLTNEFALNGWAELACAYLTADLDYRAYYALLPANDAARRAAGLLDQPEPAHGLTRRFPARVHAAEPRDVIVVIEESLGSVFSRRFGGNTVDPVTPFLDQWSHQGIALTSVVANGNRTVRGMEGVLCSFLPLPPDAIIKRPQSTGVASMAAVLADRGYQTTFYYGGYGLFDNTRPFMLANGFQRFVEQPDYPSEAFRTIWGVADEFVFDRMIRDQRAARAARRPWFATILTVSNHKPFDIPPGRVVQERKSLRHDAMRYADWALNKYLTELQALHLLDRSVVLIVGDHGARIYGVEEIPVASYHVPAFILTPDAQYHDTEVTRLVSQVDLAPTVLSLAGIEYDAPFFGRDVVGLPDAGGRAFVNHNRSIGIVTDSAMAVLQLHQGVSFYTRPDRSPDGFAPAPVTPPLRELAADAEALYQVADRVYRDHEYVLRAKP